MKKKISISSDRLKAQMGATQRSEYLNKKTRPNKGTLEDIISFEHYYSGKKLIKGVHGPELHNGKVYISVYHFMQYENIDPEQYDTIGIGGRLSEITSDYHQCQYEGDSYTINKYEYSFLKEMQESFKNFKV